MLRLPQRNKQAPASTGAHKCVPASQSVQSATSGPGSPRAAGHRQHQRPLVLITPLSKAIEPVSPRCIDLTHVMDSKPCNWATPAAHQSTGDSTTSNAAVPAGGMEAAAGLAAAAAQPAAEAAAESIAAAACSAASHAASEPSSAAVPIAPEGTKDIQCQRSQQQQPVSDDEQDSSSPDLAAAAANFVIPKTPFYVYTSIPLSPTLAEEDAPHPTHKLITGKNGKPKVKPTKFSSIQLCRQQSLLPADVAAVTAQHSTPAQHQHQPKPATAHCSHLGSSYQLPSALDATLLNINRTWLETKARDIKVVAAFSGAAVFSPPGSQDLAIASAVLSLLQEVARASQLRNRHRALQMLQRFSEPQSTGLPPAAPLGRIEHLKTPTKRAQSSAPTVSAGAAAVQAAVQAAAVTALSAGAQQLAAARHEAAAAATGSHSCLLNSGSTAPAGTASPSKPKPAGSFAAAAPDATAAVDTGSNAAPAEAAAAAAAVDSSSTGAPSTPPASLVNTNIGSRTSSSRAGSSSGLAASTSLGLQHVLSDVLLAATGVAGGTSSVLDRPSGTHPAALLTLNEACYCTSQPDTPTSFAGSHALSSCSGTISSSEGGELDRPSYIGSVGGCSSGGATQAAAELTNPTGVDSSYVSMQQGYRCHSEARYTQRLQLQSLVTVSACSSGSALSGNGGVKGEKSRGFRGWWRRVRKWGQGTTLGLRRDSSRLAAAVK